MVIGGAIGASLAPTVEDIEKEQTGGLSYDDYQNFGALAAERGLSMAAGSSKGEFQALYEELGYDMSVFDSVWEKMQEMGTAFDELANSAW
jgi:hypothetical protein